MEEFAERLRDLQTAMGDAEVRLAQRMRLSPRDLAALTAIAFAAEAPSPTDVSRRLGITAASVTDLVDRLHTAGHVTRRPHPQDRRRVVLEMTSEATTTVLAHLAPLLGDLGALGDDLDDDERAVVARFLDRATAVYRRFAQSEAAEVDPGRVDDAGGA